VTKQSTSSQSSRRYLTYATGAVFIVIGGISLFLLGQQRRSETTPDVTTRLESPGVVDVRTGAAILFFIAEGGLLLVPHEQQVEIDITDDSLTRARVILKHQLGAAPAPLASPFPEGTELRAVYLTPNGDAFVDLNREVTQKHGGGSLDELLTIYALVNALTTNMPEISTVQILIEGLEVDTLAGHIDIRHPLRRNMKWVAGTKRDSESEPTSPEG